MNDPPLVPQHRLKVTPTPAGVYTGIRATKQVACGADAYAGPRRR